VSYEAHYIAYLEYISVCFRILSPGLKILLPTILYGLELLLPTVCISRLTFNGLNNSSCELLQYKSTPVNIQ
jgi:hypothetical protein